MREEIIDTFVSELLLHSMMRAAGASKDQLRESALNLRSILLRIGLTREGRGEIGEHLAAHIMLYGIRSFSGINVSAESDKATLDADDIIQRTRLANFVDAVFLLDGAYGINSGQLMSLITRYLEEVAKKR